jgi:hypothetical protein
VQNVESRCNQLRLGHPQRSFWPEITSESPVILEELKKSLLNNSFFEKRVMQALAFR